MSYHSLDKIQFGEVVTGQLADWALWLEQVLNEILCDFFITEKSRKAEFKRVILHREGLTFQDKIEIVRALIPVWEPLATKVKLKTLLQQVEQFKAWRNATAHGLEVGDNDTLPALKVETVSRSGKPVVREITPESHSQMMDSLELLYKALASAHCQLKAHFDARPSKR